MRNKFDGGQNEIGKDSIAVIDANVALLFCATSKIPAESKAHLGKMVSAHSVCDNSLKSHLVQASQLSCRHRRANNHIYKTSYICCCEDVAGTDNVSKQLENTREWNKGQLTNQSCEKDTSS